jgi:hypothetical protein
VARFVIECQQAEGPSRQVYVTSGRTPRLAGAPLVDGEAILFRGRRWHVTLVRESVDRYVLTPVTSTSAAR